MNAKINTVNVKLDITPMAWLSDQRIQSTRPSYMNLLCHAMTLHATTGSRYVDGEFSLVEARKRVQHLTNDAVQEMIEAGLVWQVDGDLWRVEFPNPQTSHDDLQAAAISRAKAADTRRANRSEAMKSARGEANRQASNRERNAERQARHRDRQTQTSVADREACGARELDCDESARQYTDFTIASIPHADDEPPF